MITTKIFQPAFRILRPSDYLKRKGYCRIRHNLWELQELQPPMIQSIAKASVQSEANEVESNPTQSDPSSSLKRKNTDDFMYCTKLREDCMSKTLLLPHLLRLMR